MIDTDNYEHAWVISEDILYKTERGETRVEYSEPVCVCETEEDAIIMREWFVEHGLADWKQDHFWDRSGHDYTIMPIWFIRRK